MRLSSLVLGAVLMSTSASSDELVWTSVGKVKSIRFADTGRIDFSAGNLNLCGPNNDRYFIERHLTLLPSHMSLLLSAMANEYEVRIVATECEKTDMGLAAEVKQLMVVRP